MQRVGTLIDKLQEQYRRDGDVNALLLTAQMLVNELSTKVESTTPSPTLTHAAVLLARSVKVELPLQVTEETSKQETEAPQRFELEVEPQPEIDGIDVAELPEAGATEVEAAEIDSIAVETKAEPAVIPEKITEPQPAQVDFFNGQQWLFDMQPGVPTLAQQPEAEAGIEPESVNDKLKVERKELGSVLKEAPIKDLKKAIGINDRYQFINELFRGDENMFERSLKTINSFNVYSEAEYWIKRELKLKLGWNEESEIVKHFDHLVKRRFL